jgi:hypothetical protein
VELGGDRCRFTFQPPMGDANDAVSRRLHCRVADAVALERGSVPVKRPAVYLNDQLRRRPVSIDLSIEDQDIGQRGGKVVVMTKGEKARLERGAGWLGHARGVDQAANRTKSVASAPSGADALQVSQLDQAEPVCLLEGPLEPVLVDDLGEVEERAGDGRNRDPIEENSILAGDPALANGDASPLPSPRSGDFDAASRHSAEPPERRCTPVAEDRAVATGQDGRHQPSSRRHVAMAEHIDAVVQAVEATRFDAACDRAPPESRIYELLPGENTVLPASEGGQLPFALRKRTGTAPPLTCHLLSTHMGT